MPVAILIIFLAILFSSFRALTPWAKQYKGEVEHHLSLLIGQPVTINNMETSWYWFEPVLKLNTVTIRDAHDQIIQLHKLLVGINLFSSLWHWQIQPGILYVDDVNLTLRQENNHWQIDGLSGTEHLPVDANSYLPLLTWILNQQKIIVRNVSANIYLKDGSVLPMQEVNVTADNRNGHYRLKGHAKLEQETETEFSILADMDADPSSLKEIQGHVYISLERLLPSQWQEFFPISNFHVDEGVGNVQSWIDFEDGKISTVQTVINFEKLAWGKYGDPKEHLMPSLHANLAWKPTKAGWKLTGDQIRMQTDEIIWPENKLKIKYASTEKSFDIYTQDLLMAPLLNLGIELPENLQPLLARHPEGKLFNTQLGIAADHVNYLLTQFKDLSWQEDDKFPGGKNLAGVLSWEPNEGRLEIDANDAFITPKNLPPIAFAQINGAFDWKDLSDGLRISMERLILQNPNVLLSARGVLDDPWSDEAHIRLSAEFSADDAQRWMTYLPSSYLKIKLDKWLKNDIKHIAKAEGQLRVFGALADFPFDTKPGEFSITSHLQGVDLLINDRWPLSEEIDAYLRVNKRKLEADVLHANFQGIVVDKMNLLMEDVGLNRETLCIHGQVEAAADKVMDYVFKTPLGDHLSKLKRLDLKGPLKLDLRFEVPLYPENDDVLSRGLINFENNDVIVHHSVRDMELNNLTGSLQFDEHGITDSGLQATLFGDPITLFIQSIRDPEPYTEVRMEGNTTIEILKNKFNIPIFSLFQGYLKLTSLLTLTDDPNDLDHIRLSTDLKGVAVNLPFPLGKAFEESVPLIVDVDFNPSKGFRLRVNYDKRLSSDLWFAYKKRGTTLQKGEILLGKGSVVMKQKKGVKISGFLPIFDVAQWESVLAKVPGDLDSPRLIDDVTDFNLSLGALKIWDYSFPNVKINAHQLAADDWSLKINQRDVAASLRYQSNPNVLSGVIDYLHVAKSALASQHSKQSFTQLKPDQIPNLDVTVNDLKIGDWDVGAMSLKSNSSPALWQIENCKIRTPSYQLTLKGNWTKNSKENKTQLEAYLQVQDLDKSLQRLNIMPVVQAHYGQVQFHGGWEGGIHQFTLPKLNGSMQMVFKKGVITNLSPETESKLGMGKLLSILSLQTIPRRLQLDFSDLANSGYSFDEMKGNFELKNGVMSTTDSYIDGPVAYASMKGDLNLVKQLYDVDLHVNPHITASLPIVATIAGGPIAGLATWVASKIINRGMQKISGYTYKVTGPWLDPVVQQVSIIRQLKDA
jgi:uncharacterized protein (TIGR02099 family)